MLQSARGPLPNLAEWIAGEPIRGSWWGHPCGHETFAALTSPSRHRRRRRHPAGPGPDHAGPSSRLARAGPPRRPLRTPAARRGGRRARGGRGAPHRHGALPGLGRRRGARPRRLARPRGGAGRGATTACVDALTAAGRVEGRRASISAGSPVAGGSTIWLPSCLLARRSLPCPMCPTAAATLESRADRQTETSRDGSCASCVLGLPPLALVCARGRRPGGGWRCAGRTWYVLAITYTLLGAGRDGADCRRLFARRSFKTTRSIRAVLAVLGSTSVPGPVIESGRHASASATLLLRPTRRYRAVRHVDQAAGSRRAVRGLAARPRRLECSAGRAPGQDPAGQAARRTCSPTARPAGDQPPVPALGGPRACGPVRARRRARRARSPAGSPGCCGAACVRVVLPRRATLCVDSLCHLLRATRRSRTPTSRATSPGSPLIAVGEAWHDDRHAFPTSARHGLGRWRFDSRRLADRPGSSAATWRARSSASARRASRPGGGGPSRSAMARGCRPLSPSAIAAWRSRAAGSAADGGAAGRMSWPAAGTTS